MFNDSSEDTNLANTAEVVTLTDDIKSEEIA